MAVGETVVTVVGNVSSELSIRDTHSGRVAGFWLRSNERRYDKDAEEWRNGRSLAVRVSCWRRLAENVEASLSKGDPVVVTGRLHTNEYVADGRSRSVTELEASAVGPNLSWCTSTVERGPRRERTGGVNTAFDSPVEAGQSAVEHHGGPLGAAAVA